MVLPQNELKAFLDEKYTHFNRPFFIEADPIQIPHRFTKKEDIEIAAFFAATIAWGNRKSIIANASKLMQYMDNAPHDFILQHSVKQLKPFKSFVHRTFNGNDTLYFIAALQNIYKNHQGLEHVFLSHLNPSDTDVFKAIVGFRQLFLSLDFEARTAKHVSNPATGSAAKRLCMFLRWMVRKDSYGVDFGLWPSIPEYKHVTPALLCCPLDVHSGGIARKLGLLQRKQNDWKAVIELTGTLKRLDHTDPIKYDLALFGLGAFEKF